MTSPLSEFEMSHDENSKIFTFNLNHLFTIAVNGEKCISLRLCFVITKSAVSIFPNEGG